MSRVGDTKLEFGSTDETWGLIQATTSEETSEKKLATRGNGNIAAAEYYNAGVKRISGTYLFRAELVGSSPRQNVGNGTSITLQTSGDSIYVERATTDWKSGDWKQVSFEGDYFPNLGS